MYKSVADKVVTALRSGEYTQTSGRLKNGRCFCVWGVLCDLAAKEGVGMWDGDEFLTTGRGFLAASHAPQEVREWAGALDNQIELTPAEKLYVESIRKCRFSEDSLSGLNDDGVPFPILADIIENHWREI